MTASHQQKLYKFLPTPEPLSPIDAAVAVQSVLLLEGNVTFEQLNSLVNVQLPGRMEYVEHANRRWVLDIAHNPDAAGYVRSELDRRFPDTRFALLFGTLNDKDAVEILQELQIPAERTVFTDTTGARRLNAKALANRLPERKFRCISDLSDALQQVIAMTDPKDVILVTGCFDVVARTRARIVENVPN